MADRRLWSREELILAFNLYLKIEFGKTHTRNQKIVDFAALIGRTPSSVVMRLGNFASVDPYHQQRGVVGLKNGVRQVQPIWEEFFANQETLLFESERILADFEHRQIEEKYENVLHDLKELKGVDKIRAIKTRVNQSVFRQIVLANYSCKCAITGIDIPELLNASHIIPWSVNERERLNPENGICLSPLYDKAFDVGLLSFDENYRVLFASKLKQKNSHDFYGKAFSPIEGVVLAAPIKYLPSKAFLEYHRDVIFNKD